MNQLAIVLILFIANFLPREKCGTYRWDYKVLIDTAGLRVFGIKPHPGKVDDLVRLARPHKEALEGKRASLEKQQVTVTAFVVAAGKEDDHDYHLVLKSPNNDATLIAEIPDPDCPELKHFPGLKTAYKDARAFVRQEIDDKPEKVKPLATPLKVQVTGVVFFDKMSHGNGHSVNGVEIHPILKINKAA